jgi:hypothetical protein
MTMRPTTGAAAAAARALVHVPEHPSAADFYEALNGPLWEALAVAAAEGVVTEPPSRESLAKLVAMGLLQRGSGRPTAAGYALLLRWHRAHRRRHSWRPWPWPYGFFESRHVRRMRRLWGC